MAVVSAFFNETRWFLVMIIRWWLLLWWRWQWQQQICTIVFGKNELNCECCLLVCALINLLQFRIGIKIKMSIVIPYVTMLLRISVKLMMFKRRRAGIFSNGFSQFNWIWIFPLPNFVNRKQYSNSGSVLFRRTQI